MIVVRLALAAMLAGSSSAYAQQPTARPAQQQPAAPAPAPQPDTSPEQTTATFGDWTVRCQRVTTPTPNRICEMTQAAQQQQQGQVQAATVMQVAIGRLTRTDPLRLTVLVPANVLITGQPRVVLDEREPPFPLVWQRCIPGGCFASVELRDEAVRRLRARTEPGRVDYRDAAERDVQLPLSFRGFQQAFDALSREG